MITEQTPQGSTGVTQNQVGSAGAEMRSSLTALFSKETPKATEAVSTNESTRSETPSSDPNTESNQTETDQLPDSEQETNATSLEADKQPKQFQSRGDKRFQELANEIKTLKAQLQTKNDPKSQEQVVKEDPKLVPEPKKPDFTKEQLDQAEQIARQNGDENLMRSVMTEREKLRQFDIDQRFWKLENGKKIEEYQSVRNHHIQEAVKKWPDLAKSESDHYKMFQKISEQVPELLNRSKGDGEYLLAEVANVYLQNNIMASKLAALEKTSKQTETENTGLRKKIAPVVQKQSLNVGATNGKKLTAGEELRQSMQILQEAGRLGK